MKQEVVDNGSSIYVGDLNASIYIVTIRSNEKAISTKFIKQ